MACATLYVISQVVQSKKLTIKALTGFAPNVKSDENITNDQVDDSAQKKNKKPKKKESTIILSNVVVENPEDEIKGDVKLDEVVEVKTEFKATSYDPFERNPLRAGANLSFYSELAALVKHFHPSVSLFAHNIIQGLFSSIFNHFLFASTKEEKRHNSILFNRKTYRIYWRSSRGLELDSFLRSLRLQKSKETRK